MSLRKKIQEMQSIQLLPFHSMSQYFCCPVFQSKGEQRPCAQISVHAKSEPEVFYTTASEVITNGHRREGR